MSDVLQTYILPDFVTDVIYSAHAVAVWETASGPCALSWLERQWQLVLMFLAFPQADLMLHFT